MSDNVCRGGEGGGRVCEVPEPEKLGFFLAKEFSERSERRKPGDGRCRERSERAVTARVEPGARWPKERA